MKKVVSFFLWFYCLMAVLTCCGEMISASNTFTNLLGGGLGLIFLLVSVKTRCFTKSWEETINEKN